MPAKHRSNRGFVHRQLQAVAYTLRSKSLVIITITILTRVVIGGH